LTRPLDDSGVEAGAAPESVGGVREPSAGAVPAAGVVETVVVVVAAADCDELC